MDGASRVCPCCGQGLDRAAEAAIGRRVADARRRAGLRQADVGRRLDPPTSHLPVSRIERGVAAPNPERLSQVAAILGVDRRWLEGVGA